MTVMSKLRQDVTNRIAEINGPSHILSKGLLGSAVLLYAIKLSYPYIKRKCSKATTNAKITENNNYYGNKLNNGEVDTISKTKKKKQKLKVPGLDREFLQQLQELMFIMIPRPMCMESGLLAVHTLCLISRTFLSIYVASMEGAIVKHIVRKDFRNFMIMLLKWFGIAIPATFVNSMIRYLENKLALAFRYVIERDDR